MSVLFEVGLNLFPHVLFFRKLGNHSPIEYIG